MLSAKEYMGLSAAVLAIVIVGAYFLGGWSFSNPHGLAEALRTGKIQRGMRKTEVAALLGGHWQKDRTVVRQFGDTVDDGERWCRWGECAYFDQDGLLLHVTVGYKSPFAEQ